ncbi:MAG: hypothetical protein R2752_21915 [Vicinamibacterales bacterium]
MTSRPVRATGAGNDRGVTLVVVLLVVIALHAAGLGLAMVAATDQMVSRSRRAAIEGRHASAAVLERVIDDLRLRSDWTAVLGGLDRSAFLDATRRPVLASGRALDLDAIEAALQAESDRTFRRGPDNPRWTLFASGPLVGLTGSPVAAGAPYLAAWVADDPSESDGLPSADANQVISIRAMAFGPGPARSETAATLAVVDDGSGGAAVRVLSWREIR